MVQPAYAAGQTHWYVQMTIDTEHWTLAGSVVQDSVLSGTFGVFTEAMRISGRDLDALNNNTASLGDANKANDTVLVKSTSGVTLTFPGKRGVAASTGDMTRAQMVVDYLLSDLNRAIQFCWPDAVRSKWTVDDFVEKMNELIVAAESSGSVIVGNAVIAPVSSINDRVKMDGSVSAANYKRLTVADRDYYLLVSFPKGYTQKLAGMAESDGEPSTIYWRTLVWEAIYNYRLIGDAQVSVDNVYDNGNLLSNTIATAIQELCNGVRGVLNLWSADELIYNAGIRGTAEYIYGIFPAVWEPYIWMMFGIFELIAVMLLLYSIVMTATRRALATANMMGRKHAWEQLKNLILVALLLTALPLIVQILLSFSSSLTGIFYSALDGNTIVETRKAAGSGGGLTGAVIQLLYFGMDVYFNFYYMLRGIAIAVMIAIAPLCIVAMTFDSWMSKIASVWAKELAVNVFLQPMHAFLFVFACVLPKTGHGFDTIILMYAIIPFTTILRNTLFGGAGAALDKAAASAKKTATGVIGGAAAAGAVFAAKTGAKAVSGFGDGIKGQSSGGSEAPAPEATSESSTETGGAAVSGEGVATGAAAGGVGAELSSTTVPQTTAESSSAVAAAAPQVDSSALEMASTAAAAQSAGGFFGNLKSGMKEEFNSAEGGVISKGFSALGYGAGYMLGNNGVGALGERIANNSVRGSAAWYGGQALRGTAAINTKAVDVAHASAKYIAPVAGVGLSVVGSAMSGAGGGFGAIGKEMAKGGAAMCRGGLSGLEKVEPRSPGTPQPVNGPANA